MRRVYRLMIFVFGFLFITCGFRITADAANTGKSVQTVLSRTTATIQVKYNGVTIAKTAVAPKVMYVSKDITFVRRGPGTQFRKVKTIKFDLGKRLVRIGNVNRKWSVLIIKGKIYYISNKFLSATKPSSKLSTKKYTPRQFKRKGVIYWNGWRWTWYSQKVLPGRGLHIPGRHVDSNGYVCDKKGYICLASGRLRKGTIVKTPFGKKGKVYDSGCARGTLDVYTNF